MKNLCSFLALTCCLIHTASAEIDPAPFDHLAIQDHGRKKPFTSFTQEMTLLLTGRSEVEIKDPPQRWSPVEFILELWLAPDGWEDRPILLVDFLPLRQKLGLAPEQKRFSYIDLKSNTTLTRLMLEANRRQRLNPNTRLEPLLREVNQVSQRLQTFEALTSGQAFKIVPHPTRPDGSWVPVPEALHFYNPVAATRVQELLQNFTTAYAQKDARTLASTTQALANALRSLSPQVYPGETILDIEATYLRVHPWRWAWICYALAAFIFALTTGWMKSAGYRLGYGLALLGFALQVYGFVSRCVVAGRPPVTNMYESIIWVACGAVLFALIMETIYKSRYFLIAATPFAVAALILVDAQSVLFDHSIQPLVPVLRNNFWLTIHVLTITLSYGAFALALGLGHVTLIKRMRGTRDTEMPLLYQYLYRTLQVGVLLLAIGTILGGVWANYSWGRFWDWDPKETWALIALLCYLILLHGRLASWWGGFGLSVGAVLGFLSVLMAWYGVNFVLGKGLHSYGFGSGGLIYAGAFVVIELIFTATAIYFEKSGKSRL